MDLHLMGQEAKVASRFLAQMTTQQKNAVISAIADRLESEKDNIVAINKQDYKEAEQKGMEPFMLDRLSLDGRVEGIVADLRHVVHLNDPVGEIFDKTTREDGLKICKIRTPIGVIGVIYESRPNVTLDIASLCLKTGNAAILRGGSETLRTNRILVKLIQDVLKEHSVPVSAIQFIDSNDRSLVKEMLQQSDTIDLIIPRGGEKLHRFCRENSHIPVITGGIGVCHLFVDETAQVDKAIKVLHNAKTQRPTVCNSLDTVIVHAKIAEQFLPKMALALLPSNVTLHADTASQCIFNNNQIVNIAAQEKDWDREWLTLDLGVKVVDDLSQAIEHIQKHSTKHSDGILTEDQDHAKRFIREIDSAAVYVNASTRFTDGAQLGLGAEVAVSTQPLHARGPMGLQELTTYKWIVEGEYHVRS
ncbi:MAG: glutamate-5-semialdehyde dehydrogenase [Parachlamydiales bacterium]|nr:glutamate-5-semialdehyde dehydrogenase [Parachlamydiales bacterium]